MTRRTLHWNGFARRVARLEAARPTGRLAIVVAADGPDASIGSVEPLPSLAGFALRVPFDFASSPMDGLTPNQREFLRREDRVVIVEFVDEDGTRGPF